MSRTLTTALGDALKAGTVHPIILVKIETKGPPVLVWTGRGDITFNGEVFKGIGYFGGISPIEESSDLTAFGIEFSLSGIPSNLVSLALEDIEHNRDWTIWLGAIDIDSGELIADPYELDSGLTDVPSIHDTSATSTIKLTGEKKLITLNTSRERRYTSEDQKIDFPNDKGFDFVPGLQNKSVVWGKDSPL